MGAIWQPKVMINFHWAYTTHLVHLKETSLRHGSSSVHLLFKAFVCLQFLNAWWNVLRSQHSCSKVCLRLFRDGFGKLFQLLYTFHYAFILHIGNGVYEKEHYNQLLIGKISCHICLGHYKEDPVASVNFSQETVYSGVGKDPLLLASGKLPLQFICVHRV